MRKLLDLPSELLSMIAHELNPDTIITFRSVCRDLRSVGNEAFALRYCSERNHVVSLHSITTLVAITAHPFFGRYVKAVVLSGVRTVYPTRSIPDLPASLEYGHIVAMSYRDNAGKANESNQLNNYFVTSGQCAGLLETAFENIRRNHNEITIGVCDYDSAESKKSYGWKQLFMRPGTGYVYHMVETMDLAVAAAEKIRCRVSGLKIGLRKPSMDYEYQDSDIFMSAIEKLLDSTRTSVTMSLHQLGEVLEDSAQSKTAYTAVRPCLSLKIEAGSRHHEILEYDRETGKLEMRNLVIGLDSLTTYTEYYFSSSRITSVIMTNCSIFSVEWFANCFVKHNSQDLIRVHIDDNDLTFDGDWDHLLNIFADCPNLRYCHLHGISAMAGPEAREKIQVQFPGDLDYYAGRDEENSAKLEEIAAVNRLKISQVSRAIHGQEALEYKPFSVLLAEAREGSF